MLPNAIRKTRGSTNVKRSDRIAVCTGKHIDPWIVGNVIPVVLLDVVDQSASSAVDKIQWFEPP